MKKLVWVVWVVAAVLLVLGASVWWLYRSKDDLLASALRGYGPEVTGVPVELGSVHLSPLDGMATLQGLQLGNPSGFHTPHALRVQQVSIQLSPATLRQAVVHIQEIRIEQPEVGYEHGSSGSNLEAIQRHVQAYVAAHSPAADAGVSTSVQAPKTRVVIEQFNMLGAKAQVSADALQGRAVTLVQPDIHLRNIGRAAGGVTPAEATEQIVSAIRQETTKAVLPLHLDGVVGGIKQGASALVDKVKGFFK